MKIQQVVDGSSQKSICKDVLLSSSLILIFAANKTTLVSNKRMMQGRAAFMRCGGSNRRSRHQQKVKS
jgi:hypothetical protein